MMYRTNRANGESREEEYLRRMRALGYEPSLAGMDDDDIDWELQRMDGGKREERSEQPLYTTYRPRGSRTTSMAGTMVRMRRTRQEDRQ